MRPGALVLAAALAVAAAAPLHADEWTLIDVTARLANDGRATIVETHHIVLEATDKKVFRTFGLGADQAIRLSAITRLGPEAGAERRLTAVESVTGPDEYRYYDRGHVYYAIPPLGEQVTLAYRFEYELVGAVAPAWAIGAGPASRAADEVDFQWPWYRALEILADWRRASPGITTRYRYDHDVLLPSRDGPGYVFKQIDYRLEYDTAWRDTAPARDIGEAVPSGAFRVARTFDYLGTGVPLQASSGPAAARLLALILPIVAGVGGWLLVVGSGRWRRGPPIDRTFVDTRFLTRSPEEIAFWLDDVRPEAARVLERLAGEGAITIHVDRPAGHSFDDDDSLQYRLHMRRLAPDATLTPFEDALLDDVFADQRELTAASHRARHAGADYDPQDALDRRVHELARVTGQSMRRGVAGRKGRWSIARVGLGLVFAAGVVGIIRNVGALFDSVPVAAIAVFFMLALVTGWPTGWWHRGRPVRGLLVPLVVLVAIGWVWLLLPNRPLPADAWIATAVAVIAGYFLTLTRSRMPAAQGSVVADLLRMRDYAGRELRHGRPQLDDRWIPRLRALGLGSAIDAWRARHSGAGAMPPGSTDRPRITNAHFTGVAPPPWAGPPRWSDALTLYADEPEDDEDDEDEHADAADDDPHGGDPRGTGKA